MPGQAAGPQGDSELCPRHSWPLARPRLLRYDVYWGAPFLRLTLGRTQHSHHCTHKAGVGTGLAQGVIPPAAGPVYLCVQFCSWLETGRDFPEGSR